MKNSFFQDGYNQVAYESAILAYLRNQQKGVTLQDVVINTALNTAWTEYTLRQMLGKYPAYLEINEKQELLYLFDFTPKSVSVGKQVMQGVYTVLWAIGQVFMFAFKVWTVGMLLTYALAYVLVLVIALTAITRSGDILGAVLEGIWSGLKELWNMLMGKSSPERTESDKRLLTDIFSYIFGATPPKEDKLATEKLILQQIRAQAGKLVPADIVRLTGWALKDARIQAAYLLANYEGEVSVTPEGKIEYHFPNLVKDEAENTLPAPAWERPYVFPKMNNLDKGTHQIVTGLNIFNMVMAIISPFILFLIFPELSTTGVPPDWVIVWFMAVPFIFSLIFVGIPLCRYPFVSYQKGRAKQAYNRLLILGKIYEYLPQPIIYERRAKTFGHVIREPKEKAQKIFENLHIDMEAEVHAAPEGTIYTFKELI